jgi:hypothetical protein
MSMSPTGMAWPLCRRFPWFIMILRVLLAIQVPIFAHHLCFSLPWRDIRTNVGLSSRVLRELSSDKRPQAISSDRPLIQIRETTATIIMESSIHLAVRWQDFFQGDFGVQVATSKFKKKPVIQSCHPGWWQTSNPLIHFTQGTPR